MNPPQPKQFRVLRRCLLGTGICLTLIFVYYTEELWRGKRAWEKCKHELEAQGIDLKWNDYTPAPVADEDNFFAAPEMQKWFVGRGATELFKNLANPNDPINSWDKRMTVAELTIALPGTPAPSGSTVLRWDDPALRGEAARLLINALGPTATAPQSPYMIGFMTRRPEEIEPARIYLQCQTAPTLKELWQFMPDTILVPNPSPSTAVLKFESNGANSYRVTIPKLAVASDYLAWTDQYEPRFKLIRQALKRPSARMQGDYTDPAFIPIPNFVAERQFAQTLGARAECDFLLKQPDEALRDLKLINDTCRPIMEENKPMTLISAMINVAVRGLYAGTIADGLRLHVWREPQLAALEEQLKSINVLLPVREASGMERIFIWHELGTKTPTQLVKTHLLSGADYKTDSWQARKWLLMAALLPRGWVYQNMVSGAAFQPNICIDPEGQIIFPERANANARLAENALAHWSPYTFIGSWSIPNYIRAFQKTAQSQTQINQALIACALERHRLAHGEYPETLDALVPQFIDKIPRDVIGGELPHYRRTADGNFVLYSIGWTGKDNGGVPNAKSPMSEGDWVWPE